MPHRVSEQIVFIAGPTASGKSAAALALACELDGEIINADSMQVYSDLCVLTARPSPDDEAQAPHHLYGLLDGAERCSAGRWAAMASTAIDDVCARGKPAIVAGGTGLYFRALEEGLSPIPETPEALRQRVVQRRDEIGPAAFHAEVADRDPAMARLPAGDAQRLLRAWEVHAATGKPLSHFQSLPRTPLIGGVAARVVIEPDRAFLYERCDARAEAMLKEGGVEEARRLLARRLDPSLPVMKALGVEEIAALLRGEADVEQTLAELQRNTRRFAKRQLTWFRNQASGWPRARAAEAATEIVTRQLSG